PGSRDPAPWRRGVPPGGRSRMDSSSQWSWLSATLTLLRQDGIQQLLVHLDLSVGAHLQDHGSQGPCAFLCAEVFGELRLLCRERRRVRLRPRENAEEDESRGDRHRRTGLARGRLKYGFEEPRRRSEVGNRSVRSEIRSRLHLRLVARREDGERRAQSAAQA